MLRRRHRRQRCAELRLRSRRRRVASRVAREGFRPRVGRSGLDPAWNRRVRRGLGWAEIRSGLNRTRGFGWTGIKTGPVRSDRVGRDWAAYPAGLGLTERGLKESFSF